MGEMLRLVLDSREKSPIEKSPIADSARRARRRTMHTGLLVGVLVGLVGCRPAPDLRGVSVLLISPDSLRADRLVAFDDDASAATPNLDALAATGTVFTNAWATAPWTAPAMVSVMTGHYPPAHGVVYRDDTTPSDLASLPRVLGDRGYAVGNFTFFSALSYFRNLGLGPTVPGANHRNLPKRFEAWLRELEEDRPFFAWVHMLETHLPYGATGYRAAAPQVRGSEGLEAAQTQATVPVNSVRFEPGDADAVRALYDRDIESMDEQLGRLIEALDATGRRDRTLIVFVSDHGEELFDGGSPPWIGHASTAAEARLLPSTLRVPLVLAGPSVTANRRVGDLVQPVDVLATLASWLRAPELRGDGKPLPGTESGFRWPGSIREYAYFDSSPGGNLTPADQRGERMQGVTDGRCLYVETVGGAASSHPGSVRPVEPSSGECVAQAERLRGQLDRWRRSQSVTRLALLRGEEQPPSSEMADGWPAELAWRAPVADVLEHQQTGGQITLDWQGGEDAGWVEYRLLGRGARLVGGVDGAFRVEQRPVTFGPIPEGFWNDVASYSPVEVRVLDPHTRARTEWRRFDVEAVAASSQ